MGSISCKDRTKALYKILFHELPVITLEIIKKNDEWKNDFKKLRELSIVLGNATWRWTKIQIISFLISGFAYTLFHFLHV
ncbi:hypothetical protein DVK85_03420 [Flavobacterium arcticum]|uniref:Uncharacterized protein n=1 Tax=Flavobacterium arcticum TaxID=1784713 RepID=A0A345H9R9_9FLAO|nr:hypothetical protein DVK85_03420 [Flavobacterium arcticum]